MVARLQQVKGRSYDKGEDYRKPSAHTKKTPCVEYYKTLLEVDPYHDTSILDPIEDEKHDSFHDAVKMLLKVALDNGLPITT